MRPAVAGAGHNSQFFWWADNLLGCHQDFWYALTTPKAVPLSHSLQHVTETPFDLAIPATAVAIDNSDDCDFFTVAGATTDLVTDSLDLRSTSHL